MTDLSIQNNLTVVYTRKAVDLTKSTDESALADYLQKYIEFAVAARALKANTDGQVVSLAEYWELRRKAAYEVLKQFRYRRLADRALQLATRVPGPAAGRPRYPRLPSSFNDRWV